VTPAPQAETGLIFYKKCLCASNSPEQIDRINRIFRIYRITFRNPFLYSEADGAESRKRNLVNPENPVNPV
jgi:hypothetical protein